MTLQEKLNKHSGLIYEAKNKQEELLKIGVFKKIPLKYSVIQDAKATNELLDKAILYLKDYLTIAQNLLFLDYIKNKAI